MERDAVGADEPVVGVAFRLPASLVDALDRETARRESERPGAMLTRSDVLREILERALVGLKAEATAEGKPP